MKRVLVSLSVAGLAAVMLSGCVYDPYYDGYYRHHYYGNGYYGPPGPAGPPPGYDDGMPPPGAPLTQKQMSRLNDPAWCNAHAQRCAELRARAGGPGYGDAPPPGYNGPQQGDDGPPPQGYNGPPPQQGNYGPPPQQGGYGPPPQGANGPPQNMQQQ